MKKAFLLLALIVGAISAIHAQVVVSGDITVNTTWTKNNIYLLSGFVYVTNGATLTIEPGTVIKGDKATKGALIVTRGAKINANGTPNEPIVFTSNEAVPSYGDWGGIILLGYAPTNQVYNGTPGLGLIEGGLDPAKALYGGGDQAGGAVATDNSGVMRYVRIEYPGIAFQPNNEINGLTMGSVGSGTTLEYIQVSYCGDDAFEWFGGTVNAKYLIAYRSLDDDFDSDNGYIGKVQFALSVRDPQVADVSGSNGFESDNNAAGDETAPKTAPTFSNITVVGPSGTAINSNYRRAAHLRRSTEKGVFNSVFVGQYPVGLFIDGDAAGGNTNTGKLIVKNSFFNGQATPLSTNAAAFDINAYATANAITSSTNSADAQLIDPFNINLPNPRPAAGSPVLTAANFTSTPRIQDAFFTPVSYAGAFGASGDWTCPWSKFANPGCIPSLEVVVSGDITTNTTWTADKTYVLNGFVYVTNCATLTIEPGTVIKGDKGTKGALIVTRCSKIIADGNVSNPIVFTTNDPNPTYGSWGGLILLGYAPTNQVYNGTPGLGLIEGGLDPAKALYGGGDQAGGAVAADNSGVLRYVRIEYPGIAFQPNNEINGLTLGGVGSGTTIDYVQVSYAGDDAFEWFGGTVNAKHLIAYRALDDDFDTDNGFNGKVQFALSVRDPQVADVSGSNGFESDNNAAGDETAPKTSPTFSNVTVVGPSGGSINSNYRRAAHLRRSTEKGVFNSVFVGSYPVGLFIDGNATGDNANTGKLIVKNSFFNGQATPLSTNAAALDINAYATANAITSSTNAADAQLVDPFNINLPNPRPAPGSPVSTGANFTSNPRIQDAFFTQVSYAGAFGPTGDWTCSWAKWADPGCIPPPTPTQVTISSDVTGNTTWTADKEYTLQGFIYVTNCATLTIEPGTVIKGDKGSKGALIVARCSKIIADGKPTAPIVFTTNDPNPTYGSWGGLIILGYAPTNQVYNGTPGLGLIEGGLDPAKALYGGGDQAGGAIANDNSGILRYVRVEYPGIAFQPNNEINGITFGGVGSGTLVDNVQVSYAGDDAFEWFGGTVNAKHLVAYRALDDDFDTDNGFTGKIQFALSVRDPQVADVSGSNGFESDNNAAGDETTPKTAPTFSNVTVVGPSGGSINSNYRRAAHLRRSTEKGVFNSVFVGGYPVGLFIDGTATALNAQTNKLIVKNSFFNGQATPLSTNAAGFDINAYATANAIVSSTNSVDAQLVDPFNIALPNPRPAPGSPVLSAGSFTSDPRIQDAFFTPVSYAGAFGPTGDWTCPWTSWTDPGCIPPPTPQQVTISSDVTSNTTWTADKEYTLQGFIYVSNCATLTIQPGTVIKGDKGSKGALIVTRCSKLIADGTAENPIVFSTNDPNPTYGSWGGLILLGYAPTNQVYNGTPGLGLIEGGLDPAKALYGGGDQAGGAIANDNSGILRYVRVEYPGIAFQPNNEINGITFGGVGSGTTVDYVEVSYAGDDAFEWFGGTVNAKHLIAYRSLDDDFDADNGYSGNIQYALSVRDPQVADVSGSNGFEIDNNAAGDDTAPKTAPTFSNVTVAGPTGTLNSNYRRAAHLRRDNQAGIFNSLLLGSYPVGIFIDGIGTGDNAQNGLLEVKNTQVHGPVDLLNTNSPSLNIDTWFATAGWGNATNVDPNGAALQDVYNLDVPNAQPTGVSSALNAAAFTAPRVDKAFFDKVTHVGAFNGVDDWTCQWAKFQDLNTDCLVETDNVDKFISAVKLFPTVANDQVTLQFTLVAPAELSVEIYGLDGQYFGQQVNEKALAGEQTYTLQTTNLTSGFYFVRIAAGDMVKTEKLIVVR